MVRTAPVPAFIKLKSTRTYPVVSRETIQRRLVYDGIRSQRPFRCLPLTLQNRQYGQEFCRPRPSWCVPNLLLIGGKESSAISPVSVSILMTTIHACRDVQERVRTCICCLATYGHHTRYDSAESKQLVGILNHL
ncbi:hypothetical protein NPIL_657211 [Nephila pilipes]|uniref:Uncharacterized protein n=1 Tax=Nephila pilipes TaxID=299642 RepID=A0A8X6UXJ7_NEPPI|nr:hypothetical protein NPIL_657211 [Nephila pilipes]